MSTPNFTDGARKALLDSNDLASKYAHPQILPVHLAVSLLCPLLDESQDQQTNVASVPLFKQVVELAHGDPELLHRSLLKLLVRQPTHDQTTEHVGLSPALAKVIRTASELSKTQNKRDGYAAIEHLILAVTEDSQVQQALSDANVQNAKQIELAVQQICGSKQIDSTTAYSESESENTNLRKFTIDMIALVREGKIDSVLSHSGETRQVMQILSRRTKNNPILIGEPGVGKTTLVAGLARLICNADAPASLLHCRLLSLDMVSLIAGCKYPAECEERMMGVLKEVEESKDTIILFIDNIHFIMDAASSRDQAIGAAKLLKLMLASGKLHRCIGATTNMEYRKYMEKDQVFRRFQQVVVTEPSVSETIYILRSLKAKYEVHHAVTIYDGAIVAAAKLAARYLKDRRLPDSAIDLIDEAAAAVRITRESQPEPLGTLERKLQRLQVEIHALDGERDEASKAQLEVAKQEAVNCAKDLRPLHEKYDSEKKRSKEIWDAKVKLDSLIAARVAAEQSRDAVTVADLEYFAIPEMKARIERLEAERREACAEQRARQGEVDEAWFPADAVGPAEIHELVARWTGIPLASVVI
jgi:ATP-dependent Clp protease ATP-binding subunit ClpB